MRYRGGGRIGGFDDAVPTKYEAVGCWKVGEACQWLHVDRWPRREITITGMPEYVDTTVGGFGEIKPNIYSDYGYQNVQWQFSDNDGLTWANIPSDSKHTLSNDDEHLALSDQLRASGNSGMPVDGRLYRVVVTSGMRVKRSDYYDTDTGTWKGRTQIWNDNVLVTFTSGPCVVNNAYESCSGTPQTSATVGVNVWFTLKVTASAVGEEHGQNYDVEYSWQSSTTGAAGTWANIPVAEDDTPGTLKYRQLSTGQVYVRAVATFTYSDPPDHIISPSVRPNVSAYSDPIFISVV